MISHRIQRSHLQADSLASGLNAIQALLGDFAGNLYWPCNPIFSAEQANSLLVAVLNIMGALQNQMGQMAGASNNWQDKSVGRQNQVAGNPTIHHHHSNDGSAANRQLRYGSSKGFQFPHRSVQHLDRKTKAECGHRLSTCQLHDGVVALAVQHAVNEL